MANQTMTPLSQVHTLGGGWKRRHAANQERRLDALDAFHDEDKARIRAERAELYARLEDERRAAEEAEAKHKPIDWPPGLATHLGLNGKVKATFAPYLAKAIADYERDHPEQRFTVKVDTSGDLAANARALDIRRQRLIASQATKNVTIDGASFEE